MQTLRYSLEEIGGKDMPLFADCLHIDHLKAPRSMTSHRSGTDPKPTVWSFFQNQQNLIRLPASLSQFTGDSKYIHAAGEVTLLHVQPLLAPRKRRSALGWTQLCGLGNWE